MSITDKYRVEEPRYLWYCGTKKYRKGDGTGTVEKWYRGAAVVPWYRATLLCIKIINNLLSTGSIRAFWLLRRLRGLRLRALRFLLALYRAQNFTQGFPVLRCVRQAG